MKHEVDFIVVGGIAAALHGAPLSTFDVDVVHSREPGNVRRLLPALGDLQAFYRTQPEKRLKPRESHLLSRGHQLLMTRHGPLDLLGTIGRGLGYDELLEHTTEMQVAGKVAVLVLNLEKLIEIMEELANDKDRAVLPLLRRVLEKKRG